MARAAFRAMGTDVAVVVHGDWDESDDQMTASVHDVAAGALEHLEARWSRFRETSDVSRINAADGRPVAVAPETVDLVARAVDAWRVTDGRFDPTVLPALVAAGYDRDFAEVASRSNEDEVSGAPTARPDARPAPGCAGIHVDPVVGAVRLPRGVAIDLGGIGKGRAADLVAPMVGDADDRIAGVLVDLGGDLRVLGEPPRDAGWIIDVDDPLGTDATGRIVLLAGAVATSTRLRRAWTRDGRAVHHLIDPRTGEPATGGLASVTVVAGSACTAEVLAKAAFVAGPGEGRALLAAQGVTGLFVHDDGHVEDLPGLASFRL